MSIFTNYEEPRRCDPQKGDKIGAYTVQNRIGEGSFGLVYAVEKDEKIFALKLLKLWEVAGRSEKESLLQRFEREYEVAQIDSAYLVKSNDYGKLNGNPWIVMEFCPNGTLANRDIKQETPETIAPVAICILKGLGDLHNTGFYHRDLKPDNILFDANDQAKLTDFGISGHKNNRLTVTNFFTNSTKQIFGTYAYMAPEQADNRKAFKALDAVADIFSFGVLMAEWLTGKLPFAPHKIETDEGLVTYIQNAKLGNFSGLETLTPKWRMIIEGCLNPNYQNGRYRSVKEILEILEAQDAVTEPIKSDTSIALRVTYGVEFGRIYQLDYTRNELLKLGIGRSCNGVTNEIEILEDNIAYISRRHATLCFEQEKGCWQLHDGQSDQENNVYQTSLNGTFLNSQKLLKGEKRTIKVGDLISLGDTSIQVINH
jgi:serine/threonine protein kinase